VNDWQLGIRDSSRIVIEKLAIADRFWSRFLGLQFRRALPPGEGMLLVPCSSIHTMWLWFPIDVAMLDRTGQVLAVQGAIRPWRLVFAPRGTCAVLEAAAGNLHLAVGEIVALHSPSGRAAPRALSGFSMG
jgi:uncharacterized membrane protein (UPF0127 family)